MELLGDVGHVYSGFGSFGYRVSFDAKLVHGLRHSMLLLSDKAQVEARFGMFGDCANLDARLVHSLPRRFHRLGSHFGRTRWNF